MLRTFSINLINGNCLVLGIEQICRLLTIFGIIWDPLSNDGHQWGEGGGRL